MSWVQFDKLTPAQSVVGQRMLLSHPAFGSLTLRRKFTRWEFQVVDGCVKGARLHHSKRAQQLVDILLSQGRYEPRTPTDLKDWKSMPVAFHMDEK